MGIAPGGLIRQTIKRDQCDPAIWELDAGTIFNVQILNWSHFREATGLDPPETTVTAQAYAEHGFPYFSMFDEKDSGIHGDFEGTKSVNELDVAVKHDEKKARAATEVSQSTGNRVVLLDHTGREVGFRPVSELKRAMRERFGKLNSLASAASSACACAEAMLLLHYAPPSQSGKEAQQVYLSA